MRLDKLLSNMGMGSRKDIKKYCRNGEVAVNGIPCKKSDFKVDPEKDKVTLNGREIKYRKYVYIMMNKPSGCVSATWDNYDETVCDIVDGEYGNFEVFPVGRLDKDTEGLIFLTNDGSLSHRLLSPSKKVPKTYYVETAYRIDEEDIAKFNQGLNLGDFITAPAELQIIDELKGYVTITEGKFHQVKRMFEACENEVVYLKRLKMGSLVLDEDLELGDYRELTEEELQMLKNSIN